MGFTKLDENILLSSIMSEDANTFKVWIALLASCKANGISPATIPYLSSVCRIDIKTIEKSIEKLSSPDKYSRSLENEGRRIERVDGGFKIINYQKYRDYSYSDSPEAIKKRKQREEKREGQKRDMSPNQGDILSSASASTSKSSSLSEEEKSAEKRNKIKINAQVEQLYQAYPKKKDKGHALKAIRSALDKCHFDTLIDHVKKYAQSVVGKDPQFIPYPATWFNGLRWEDQEEVKTEKQLRDEALAKELAEWGKKVAK